jgi:hypothetical protein
MQFSLGYRMIAATLKAVNPPMDFETGAVDEKPAAAAKHAKRMFASFQDYVNTNGYDVDSIDSIIESYIKGTGLQLTQTPDTVINLRAKVSGLNASTLKSKADQAREIAIAKKQEEINKIAAEFKDLTIYNNAYYIHSGAISNSDALEVEDSYIDIEEIILNDWVAENYPKVLKSQINYWTRFNNWDDAELVLIDSDQQTLESFNKKK